MGFIRNWSISLLRKSFDVASAGLKPGLVDAIKWDILAMQYLAPLTPNTYFAWGRSALRPRTIVTILNDIVMNRRDFIVELGSGVSTLYIARLLKSVPAKFYSIEQNEPWMQAVQQQLAQEGLPDRVKMIFAPVSPCPIAMTQNGLWYDRDAIERSIDIPRIDLLIVDGPAGEERDRNVRYPAVPHFKSLLVSPYAILLDDATRRGEREVLQRWQRELNIPFKYVGDFALGISGPALKPQL